MDFWDCVAFVGAMSAIALLLIIAAILWEDVARDPRS